MPQFPTTRGVPTCPSANQPPSPLHDETTIQHKLQCILANGRDQTQDQSSVSSTNYQITSAPP